MMFSIYAINFKGLICVAFQFIVLCGSISAQKIPLQSIVEKLNRKETPKADDFGFQSYDVVQKNDTIHFYTYQRGKAVPTSIFMYLPGSNAEDIYTWHQEDNGSYWFSSLTSFDFSFIPDDYLFVIVAKPGYGFCGPSRGDSIPEEYWDKTSLQDRVTSARVALQYIRRNIVPRPKRVAVFGYSEGFYVASKLATIEKTITHLGIGGGGGYIDFYDFILHNQIAAHRGECNPDTSLSDNEFLIRAWTEVIDNPSADSLMFGYSHKRWASFGEPPMHLLSSLDLPIFQVHGALDESTPLESAYLVPLEFARLQKRNLTFRVYSGCNHSFIEQGPDGLEIMHMPEMMAEFFAWVDRYPTRRRFFFK